MKINLSKQTMENVRFSIIENDLNNWNSDREIEDYYDKRSISSESDSDIFSNETDAIHSWQQRSHVIWDIAEIEETLRRQSLNADNILEMVKCGEFYELISGSNDVNIGLLFSALYGFVESMVILLNTFSADPNAQDSKGRTSLHFACSNGNSQIAKILLDREADPNCWDYKKEVTPLHCAASASSVECILLLLRRRAQINIGIEKRSALHFAIDRNAVECVETLLKYGANPNTPQVYTETPLHTACALGNKKCVELLLAHGADVRPQFGEGKLTALHLAAENDYVECVRILLEHGADVNCRNAGYQTPLHLACLSQSVETVEMLIKYGANVNAHYRDGRTALHAAIVKQSRCLDCCVALLRAGADVNKADNYGYTPLHIAALNEFSQCVYTFIENGADITARTDGNVSALSFIVRRTPDVIPKLISNLDASIKVNDHEIGDVDCEIKLDFRLLVPLPTLERGETDLLMSFIEVGQKRILMHPLCETFLFLKWRRIRKFFLMSLFYHAVYVLMFTIYIFGVYVRNCEKDTTCIAANYISSTGYFVVVLNLLLLVKEFFQMAHGLTGYAKYWENWLQWTIIFGVFLCVTPALLVAQDLFTVPDWQHHVAAIVMFLVWLELMMLVGRFPIFGLYIQMFTKVAMNFGKFLMAYCCLLIAFGLSFCVLFTDYPAFINIAWSLLKAITMMSGELEFEDIFYGDYPIKYPVTAHILFLSFVLLVTVILTNLMVGLAVNDIQGLQVSATLDRLVRQAELVYRLECLLFSRLLRNSPKRLLALCKRSSLLRTSRNQLQFVMRPNDPRDQQLPEELKISIYKMVAERRDRNQSLKQKKYESNCMFFNKSMQNRELNNQKSQKLDGSCILRPRSATNVPNQLQQSFQNLSSSSELKPQNDSIKPLRQEIQCLKGQLNILSEKLEKFAEGFDKKSNNVAEDLGHIKKILEQKSQFYF
ncbi:transient receptor potential channel pyrexia isoform X2 [Episyrphus balteatus]|uniref:transient receptor potential channel pyrexia isoform X2 n=1 Tax=Episyrphus balteatus TaxID=286459 RepID=UPI002486B14C|nr:transient receptor potential channel pyrexia isoform X2 [Episyrphus balteatus]